MQIYIFCIYTTCVLSKHSSFLVFKYIRTKKFMTMFVRKK